ncbi:hypothetical protein F7018_09340 [Tenacibaculum aiptasiae]|uniref:Uncharacterized protein n=1 Tax=Tenacibaculum aiptasiae TaxID=426481 RepID=A0A7J5AL94_9FLAO|nr:hypothetical protein [Tenacibaculum aiptasiae]KAB1158372.1 hypothetical protein F7018_09340 [Tenacibaculum aiptasiae]
MKFIIKKGSGKMMILMLTGVFLVIAFSYQLLIFLQVHDFVYQFPGDWDKPMGVLVGLFLILRSLKFTKESKDLFIKIDEEYLVYRTNELEVKHKVPLTNIERVYKEKGKIRLVTKDLITMNVVDLDEVRLVNETKSLIKKSLMDLNTK